MNLKTTSTGPGILRRGSTLIAVFWVMSILSIAVFTSLRLLYYEIDLVTSQTHGSRARHLAEMGIAVAVNPVVQPADPILVQEFEGGSESFEAEIKTEGGRFNINLLLSPRSDTGEPDKALFREILARWGVDIEVASEVVDALVDWIDPNDLQELNGAEYDYYEELGYLNRPYNRPFYSLDEVRLVRGWEQVERLNPNWKDWFTIWSGGALDVNEAAPALLAAAAEISEDEAQAVRDRILGPDMERWTEDDVPFQDAQEALDLLGLPDIQVELVLPRLTANDPTTRIECVGRSGDVKRRITMILRNRTGRPAILARTEEVVP